MAFLKPTRVFQSNALLISWYFHQNGKFFIESPKGNYLFADHLTPESIKMRVNLGGSLTSVRDILVSFCENNQEIPTRFQGRWMNRPVLRPFFGQLLGSHSPKIGRPTVEGSPCVRFETTLRPSVASFLEKERSDQETMGACLKRLIDELIQLREYYRATKETEQEPVVLRGVSS